MARLTLAVVAVITIATSTPQPCRCAWVAWDRQIDAAQNPVRVQWSTISAHDTKAACDDEALRLTEAATKRDPIARAILSGVTDQYSCFPDTVTPK